MPKKKPVTKDKPLKDFLEAGGRSDAEADFNAILKRAVKPTKPAKQSSKKPR